MASLALMVAIIFLSVILIGPLSMLAGYFKLNFLSQMLGAIAIILGLYWMTVAPFPVSGVGLFAIITGARCFYSRYNI